MNERRIVLDPLGGVIYDEKLEEWRFQKKQVYTQDKRVYRMYADLMTVGVANIVYDILRTVGMDVLPTRSLKHSYKYKGESGKPMFHESAYLYLQNLRLRPNLRKNREDPYLPESVWKQGETNAERDINARVNFARYVNADVVVVVDITNYMTDMGLEVAHNGVADAEILAKCVLKEMSRRTYRKVAGVRSMLDNENIYQSLDCPVIILNCGSTFDQYTAHLLRQPLYRESIGLGTFAGIWKHLMA